MKKAIYKALKNLKHIQNKLNTPGENGVVISVLRDVEAITISVLMHQKKVMCEEEQKANKFLSAEAAVRSCIKFENMKHVENAQKELQSSELRSNILKNALKPSPGV
ncbi:hypothetical protein Gotur_030715 [Gossypium turneri]